jgi:O-antigen/teichoic acid export membrane protein
MTLEKSRLRLNFAVLLLAQGYNQALLALSGLLIVRFLGPGEYGRYTLAVTGLNIGAVLADAGLSAYLNREAARQKAGAAELIWRTALRLRLGLSLGLWLWLMGVAWLWPFFGSPWLVGLAGLSLFPLTWVVLTTAFLNGQGRVPLSAGLNTLAGTLSCGLVVISLLWQPLAGFVLAANLLGNLGGAALLFHPVFGLGVKQEKIPRSQTGLDLLKASQSFFYISLASVIFQYADVYLVSILLNEEAVGQYGAALRLLTLVTTIPTVWGVIAVPRFARQADRLKAELITWGWRLTAVGVGLALLGLVVAEPVVRLVLGPKYAVAGEVLAWLLWAGAAIFASAAPVTWLTVTNRQRYILAALLGADGLGLALTLGLAGGLGWGLPGVALARVGAGWMLAGLYLFFGRAATRKGREVYE